MGHSPSEVARVNEKWPKTLTQIRFVYVFPKIVS